MRRARSGPHRQHECTEDASGRLLESDTTPIKRNDWAERGASPTNTPKAERKRSGFYQTAAAVHSGRLPVPAEAAPAQARQATQALPQPRPAAAIPETLCDSVAYASCLLYPKVMRNPQAQRQVRRQRRNGSKGLSTKRYLPKGCLAAGRRAPGGATSGPGGHSPAAALVLQSYLFTCRCWRTKGAAGAAPRAAAAGVQKGGPGHRRHTRGRPAAPGG